jgi:hypothetical protein
MLTPQHPTPGLPVAKDLPGLLLLEVLQLSQLSLPFFVINKFE